MKDSLVRLMRDSLNDSRWRPTSTPPTFSGADHESPEAFVTEIVNRLRSGDYTAEEKANIAVIQLRGVAETWYLRMYTNGPTTMAELSERLIDRYGGVMALIRLQHA